MQRKILVGLSASILLFVLAACQSGGTAAPKSTPEIKQALESGRKTIVFFLNPEGGPCRAQDGILQRLYQDRGGSFNIVYVNAMLQEHQQAFYDYGIKSLPSVVLVDESGVIATIFPPGIQQYETLAQSLDTAI